MANRLRWFAQVNPPTPEFDRLPDSAEVPFLPLEAVGPGDRIDTSRRRRKSEVASGYTRVREGDILVPKITPTFQADRTVMVRRLDGGVAAATTEVHVVRVQGNADPRYIRYLFSTAGFLAEGESRMIGVAGQKRVPDEFLRDTIVPIVDRSRQYVAASLLDREMHQIESLAAAKRQMMDLLEEKREGIVRAGVSGFLTSPSATKASAIPWLERIPCGWREAKLDLVARLGSGHTPSRARPEWWENPTIPWITTGDVAQMRSDRIEFITSTRELISEVGMTNSSAALHPSGTVILCRTASAGYSAIMGMPMATSQDFATWTCGPLLNPRFLLLCLRAMRQDLLGRLAMGSTHQTIYMPDIESIRIPLPPLEEQVRVVEGVYARLVPIDKVIDSLGEQLELLAERRRALITTAVGGHLDLTELARD